MSNPIDLVWISKCQLELIGIKSPETGPGAFCIDKIPYPDGTHVYKLRLRHDRDKFIYELHGGDDVVWQRILALHADACERWYFPDGFAAKSHGGKI